MLPISEFKKLLADAACELSEAQIEQLREEMYRLAAAFHRAWKKEWGDRSLCSSFRSFSRRNICAGILVDPWTGEEIQGRHQPMVSQEEVAHAQAILTGKSITAVRHIKKRSEFPLRAFVRCGTCRQRSPLSATTYQGQLGEHFVLVLQLRLQESDALAAGLDHSSTVYVTFTLVDSGGMRRGSQWR